MLSRINCYAGAFFFAITHREVLVKAYDRWTQPDSVKTKQINLQTIFHSEFCGYGVQIKINHRSTNHVSMYVPIKWLGGGTSRFSAKTNKLRKTRKNKKVVCVSRTVRFFCWKIVANRLKDKQSWIVVFDDWIKNQQKIDFILGSIRVCLPNVLLLIIIHILP